MGRQAPRQEVPLHALLVKMSRRTAETLSEQGLANGKCCMCNTALTDPVSMAVGYGATCAQTRTGLPYGKVAAAKTDLRESSNSLSASMSAATS